MDFSYPHPQLYFDVKGDDGKLGHRGSGSVPTAMMMKNMHVGWSRESIKPGDQVTITCNPHKEAGAHVCLCKELVIDGKKLPNSAADRVRTKNSRGYPSKKESNLTREVQHEKSGWFHRRDLSSAGFLRGLCWLRHPESSAAAKSGSSAPFDPHDISGVWYRVAGFSFSNVPNVQPGLPRTIEGGRGRGTNLVEAPFTPAGKAAFDKNKPGYGPRASPPAFGNDPMGTCDPLGIPRQLNAEVGSSHQTWEIQMTKDRMFQFFQWHHDWREVWTDGRSLPKTDDLSRSGTATRWAIGTATPSWWIRSASMTGPGSTSSVMRTPSR